MQEMRKICSILSGLTDHQSANAQKSATFAQESSVDEAGVLRAETVLHLFSVPDGFERHAL